MPKKLFTRHRGKIPVKVGVELTVHSATLVPERAGALSVLWQRGGNKHAGETKKVFARGQVVKWEESFKFACTFYKDPDSRKVEEKSMTVAVMEDNGKKKRKQQVVGSSKIDLAEFSTTPERSTRIYDLASAPGCSIKVSFQVHDPAAGPVPTSSEKGKEARKDESGTSGDAGDTMPNYLEEDTTTNTQTSISGLEFSDDGFSEEVCGRRRSLRRSDEIRRVRPKSEHLRFALAKEAGNTQSNGRRRRPRSMALQSGSADDALEEEEEVSAGHAPPAAAASVPVIHMTGAAASSPAEGGTRKRRRRTSDAGQVIKTERDAREIGEIEKEARETLKERKDSKGKLAPHRTSGKNARPPRAQRRSMDVMPSAVPIAMQKQLPGKRVASLDFGRLPTSHGGDGGDAKGSSGALPVKRRQDYEFLLKHGVEGGFAGDQPVSACLIFRVLKHWKFFHHADPAFTALMSSVLEDEVMTHRRSRDLSKLVFCMVNFALLSHLVEEELVSIYVDEKHDEPQPKEATDFQDKLAVCFHRAYCACINVTCRALDAVLVDAVFSDASALDPEAAEEALAPVFTVLGDLAAELQRNHTPAVLCSAVLLHVFRHINVQIAGRFLSAIPARSSCSVGLQIKMAVSRLERWIDNIASTFAAGPTLLDHAAPVKSVLGLTREVANVLLTSKEGLLDSGVRSDVCPSIPLPNVAAIVANFQADELARGTEAEVVEALAEAARQCHGTAAQNSTVSLAALLDDKVAPMSDEIPFSKVTELSTIDLPAAFATNPTFDFLLKNEGASGVT